MKTVKKMWAFLPELFFILTGIVAFIGELARTGKISYVSLALIAVFLLQLKLQNKTTGYILGALLALVSFYMLFAVYSEFSEFEVVNQKAIKLLAIGWALFGSVLVFSILLIKKNLANTPLK
jgi:hypothetical protein